MKIRYIPLILILAMMSSLLYGCGNDSGESAEEQMRMDVLKKFSDISAIPRNNGDSMDKISKYITDYAKTHKLKHETDKAGNILIKSPASKGYENAPVTILQTNMDMVTVASPSIIFDTKTDGITPIINEDTGMISGNHTSLGASSGLGMANIFYILEKAENHGEIKAVFTVDGEGNMNGARNIDKSFLKGDYLINLNNDISTNIETGSAYSSVLSCDEDISMKDTQNKYSFVIVADNFVGGDSGIGSQKLQANPIIFIGEVLALAKSEGLTFELNSIESGQSTTQIPKSATAVITVNEYEKSKIGSIFNKAKKAFLKEYSDTDPDAKLQLIETTVPDQAMSDDDVDSLISFLYSVVDGKYNDDDKVTASSNVTMVNVNDNKITCNIFVQSKLESAMDKMIADHKQIAKISNMSIKIKDTVSGYETDKKSYLPTELTNSYKSVLNEKVKLSYRTTRTELGFFQSKNPDISIVSIGPTIEKQGKLGETAELDTVDIPSAVIPDFLSNLIND